MQQVLKKEEKTADQHFCVDLLGNPKVVNHLYLLFKSSNFGCIPARRAGYATLGRREKNNSTPK